MQMLVMILFNGESARSVSVDIQKNGIYLLGNDSAGVTKKWVMEFSGKNN